MMDKGYLDLLEVVVVLLRRLLELPPLQLQHSELIAFAGHEACQQPLKVRIVHEGAPLSVLTLPCPPLLERVGAPELFIVSFVFRKIFKNQNIDYIAIFSFCSPASFATR